MTCLRNRKDGKPFPSLPRLHRHIKEKHMPTAAKNIYSNQLGKNFFKSIPNQGDTPGCRIVSAPYGQLPTAPSNGGIPPQQQHQQQQHHGNGMNGNMQQGAPQVINRHPVSQQMHHQHPQHMQQHHDHHPHQQHYQVCNAMKTFLINVIFSARWPTSSTDANGTTTKRNVPTRIFFISTISSGTTSTNDSTTTSTTWSTSTTATTTNATYRGYRCWTNCSSSSCTCICCTTESNSFEKSSTFGSISQVSFLKFNCFSSIDFSFTGISNHLPRIDRSR